MSQDKEDESREIVSALLVTVDGRRIADLWWEDDDTTLCVEFVDTDIPARYKMRDVTSVYPGRPNTVTRMVMQQPIILTTIIKLEKTDADS